MRISVPIKKKMINFAPNFMTFCAYAYSIMYKYKLKIVRLYELPLF